VAAGSCRLNAAQDAVWPPSARAYGGRIENPWKRPLALALLILQLTVPVLLFFTLLAAIYLFADANLPAGLLPGFLHNASLTVGDLVLPGCWTILHLTNRRYGPEHALGQLAAALGLAVLVALINPGDVDTWLPVLPSLTPRAIWAFAAAFTIANLVAIIIFDAARGPNWWSAPLIASSTAALVFCLIYYPAAFGIGSPLNMLVHLLLFLIVGVALLGPYWLLRPAMRPLNGMNGF
jgi:uncharacterized PurR-regulated membrane protein YhhQ (DUF165 family)